MHDASNAALLTKGLHPKTHSGSIRLFNMHFIKTGLALKRFAALLSRIEYRRSEADYTMASFSREDAEKALDSAKEFVSEVKSILKEYL